MEIGLISILLKPLIRKHLKKLNVTTKAEDGSQADEEKPSTSNAIHKPCRSTKRQKNMERPKNSNLAYGMCPGLQDTLSSDLTS